MRAADLCLIPARPTIFDIWASEATRGKLKTLGKDYAFVLNQCPPMQESQRVSDGAAAIEAMGGLLRPFIVARVDYQEAAREGIGVTEIDAEGKAAEEMRHLWSSLKRRLSRLQAGRKGAAAGEPEFLANWRSDPCDCLFRARCRSVAADDSRDDLIAAADADLPEIVLAGRRLLRDHASSSIFLLLTAMMTSPFCRFSAAARKSLSISLMTTPSG